MTSPTDDKPRLPYRRWAFTLVEVLLVLAIMGITTIMAMPYLVKSIRGNRLRVAANTVVRAGRYARSMAILGNREMVLSFDIPTSTLRIAPYHMSPPPSAPEPTPSRPPPGDTTADESPAPPPPQNAPSFNITRQLDAVRIESVDVEHQDKQSQENAAVLYRSNGRCVPYEVRLVDEYGATMLITVDALSSAKAMRENH